MPLRFNTPVLHTDRLTLRAIEAGDIPTIQREFGRWNIIRNMTTNCPWPYPRDGAQHWFNQTVATRYREKTGAMWAITKKEQPEVLIGVIDIREDTGDGNRGFWMSESEQGKGYMTEAVSIVNDWVFTHTKLKEIVAYNVASNEASRRVKEKTGCTYIKTVVQDYHSGEQSSEVWKLTRSAWLQSKQDDPA